MSEDTHVIDDRKARQWRMVNLTTGALLLAYCLLQILLAAGGAP